MRLAIDTHYTCSPHCVKSNAASLLPLSEGLQTYGNLYIEDRNIPTDTGVPRMDRRRTSYARWFQRGRAVYAH